MILVEFLISNTYVVNGKECRRQKIGLPMGTNCAPELANLYLYVYESNYIDRVIEIEGEQAAHEFHNTFRLIDDVLSQDNVNFSKAVAEPARTDEKGKDYGGMYPAALVLNDTTLVDNTGVNFLGMHISSGEQYFDMDVYDKKVDFDFEVIRYPHIQSVMPTDIQYGVCTGMLGRFYEICNDPDKYIHHAKVHMQIMMGKGCNQKRLRKCFASVLIRRQPLRWKISAFAMIKKLDAVW